MAPKPLCIPSILQPQWRHANLSTKSTLEDEQCHATHELGQLQSKSIEQGKQRKISDATKGKVTALQQIPNFPFHKPVSDRVEQCLKELHA